MPKDFLQGASLTPTFILPTTPTFILPFLMLKNAFKKYPLQNRTNVQIKGGGGSKAFWTMFKKTALFWNDGFPYLTRWMSNLKLRRKTIFRQLHTAGKKLLLSEWSWSTLLTSLQSDQLLQSYSANSRCHQIDLMHSIFMNWWSGIVHKLLDNYFEGSR